MTEEEEELLRWQVYNQHLKEVKGDTTCKKFVACSFPQWYPKSRDKLMSRMNKLYQEIEDCVYGMNRREIDMEKAYEMVIDAPNSESDPILNVWKAFFMHPMITDYELNKVEINEKVANELLEKAVDLNLERMAEAGMQYAQNFLGTMYKSGLGVNKDYTAAAYWFGRAAEQGHASGQFSLGYLYHDRLDFNTAVNWYRKAAEQGHVFGQFSLGAMYYDGLGVKKDYVSAIHWYRKAAVQGHLICQTNLGYMYSKGMGVEKDYIIAMYWYRKAAERGYRSAQNNLGYMYRKGKGVKKDDTTAVYWFRIAAEQGYPLGQYNLGRMYRYGLGVNKDHTAALHWFCKAAEQGHANAQWSLDKMTKECSSG